jgi:hypothetical protein
MNPYFIAGTVLAVVCAYGTGHWQGDTAGQAKVQQQWDKEKAKQMAEYAENMRLAREKEQALQQGANNLREEKDRELKKIADTNRILLGSLRNRPERPAESSAVSGAAGVGQSGCTGKELYREDGAILVGIAREADELRIALKQCYAQYETLRH